MVVLTPMLSSRQTEDSSSLIVALETSVVENLWWKLAYGVFVFRRQELSWLDRCCLVRIRIVQPIVRGTT